MTTPFLLGVLAGCSVVRVVARLSSSSLEMNGAREPCSERKFQSHPTVPPGRLNDIIWHIDAYYCIFVDRLFAYLFAYSAYFADRQYAEYALYRQCQCTIILHIILHIGAYLCKIICCNMQNNMLLLKSICRIVHCLYSAYSAYICTPHFADVINSESTEFDIGAPLAGN